LTGTIPPDIQRKIAPINNGAGSRLLQRAGQIFRPREEPCEQYPRRGYHSVAVSK